MSYILDALRKADAERERDPARGIHAQPAGAPSVPASRKLPAWAWPATTVVLAGVAGYFAWDREPSVVAAPVSSVAVAAAPVVPREADPAPAPAPAPVILPVAAPVPAPQRVVLAPRAAPLVAAKVAASAPSAPVVAKAAASAPVAAASAPQAVPAVAAAAAASAPSVAPDRIYAVAELPPDVQRELPKLTISGGVHSENATQRMLIVGGQVMNEGAQLAPGVVLEQIRPRSAVLKFKSWRYSIGY